MEKHGEHQEANDWVTCKCGKLFKDRKNFPGSKYDKLKEHLELMKGGKD
jgi:hypothetical protein